MGPGGRDMKLDLVPGVVLVDVQVHEPDHAWMPSGHVIVRVWGGKPEHVWAAVQASGVGRGRSLALVVYPASRWARALAWWRWTLHRRERALREARR